MSKKETVNHPAHYGGDTTYEAIKVIEAWELDFCLGNTVKYISRAGKKHDMVNDLEKAAWYLARRIKQLKEQQCNSRPVTTRPRSKRSGKNGSPTARKGGSQSTPPTGV